MLRKSRLGQKNGFPIKKKGVVKSRQNGIFHFVKTNRYMRMVHPTQMRSHLGRMIFLHVNSFYRAVPPMQDYLFSLDSVCFCITRKRSIHLIKFSTVDVY